MIVVKLFFNLWIISRKSFIFGKLCLLEKNKFARNCDYSGKPGKYGNSKDSVFCLFG